MAKFFVGQRVRVVRVRDHLNSHLIGLEGHISEIRKVSSRFDWDPIGLDCHPIVREFDGIGFVTIGFSPDQLEPILPEGSAPSEFTFQQLMDSLQEVSA